MDEIKKIQHLFKLKEVFRTACEMGDRPESTAEHTYSVLILAQHFLPKISQQLDKHKIMQCY
ncbi:hypothetical protein COV18_03715 [Candidatus Woesearchaeota archaeon CG10_big_fil_rev_8_21_14_0_10_37_12]|nr:MAG: hypothetical protein COV18_03715 [Candidatus Woesearchaeota archaeon CG10_big_fil_rev_8_21_14_0_10_37_12]